MKITTQPRAVRLLMCALAIALTMGLAAPRADGQERKAVNLAPARGLPFSDGIVAGNTLYIAGQEGTDDASKLVAGGIGPETTAALENIQKVLKAAGFELKDVVSVTVYLADVHEFPDMNKVYKSVMPDPKPARATIQAAALVNNARVEISAIAVKQK
jgi:2-iminobutanoate/2-iminopropanoate deaminase